MIPRPIVDGLCTQVIACKAIVRVEIARGVTDPLARNIE
jgi:hypothetical protein